MPNTPNLPPIEETTPITEILERNALLYGSDVCLVEINPEVDESRRITWKDFDLVQPSKCAPSGHRRSTTWSQFNALANRFANLLLSRGLKKGDKVGILLMNCLEWLRAAQFPVRVRRNQILRRARGRRFPRLRP